MKKQKPNDDKKKFTNIILLCTVLVTLFIILETAYRLIDPYPYFPPWQIAQTNYSHISEYDAILGWKGVPDACELLVTENAQTLVRHNEQGFRDIQMELRSPDKPAIIFLGDSYTWGHDVNFDQMFVNIIRSKINQCEVFNLGHRGYGTDQSLLNFLQWRDDRPIKQVILMFCKNDVADNSYNFRWGMHKPKFEIINDSLILTNVPVPKNKNDDQFSVKTSTKPGFKNWIKYILYQSHCLHDLHYRIQLLRRSIKKDVDESAPEIAHDFKLTDRILRKLHQEVKKRGSKLTIVTFPSVESIMNSKQDQLMLRTLCKQLSIDFLDLTPYFEKSIWRTEFRGGHWNHRGHKIAAEIIFDDLDKKGIH